MEMFAAKSNETPWNAWTIDSSVAMDIIHVVVKFWTGRVSDHDVELFLMRHGEILQPPYKPVDRFGIWYGIRKYKLQLKKGPNGQPITLPISISLGPYNGRVIYPGQRQACFVCGAPDHQVKECTQIKCWKCSGLGHRAKDCTSDFLCSLCGETGHNYFKCPHSYSNKARNQSQARAEAEQQNDQQQPPDGDQDPSMTEDTQAATKEEQSQLPTPEEDTAHLTIAPQQQLPLPESRSESKVPPPQKKPGRQPQPGTSRKEGAPLAVGRGRGRGRGRPSAVREKQVGGTQLPIWQQTQHPPSEGNRETPATSQQQQQQEVSERERAVKLLRACDVSLSSSSSSPRSGDDSDDEHYNSASEELDTPAAHGKRHPTFEYGQRKKKDVKDSPPSC